MYIHLYAHLLSAAIVILYIAYTFYVSKKYTIIMGIAFIAALYLALDRTLWLPFLGECAMAPSLIPIKSNQGDTKVPVKVSPNSKVAYWSALPGDKTIPVKDAYDKFINAGVVMSDADGNAVLQFDKGTKYSVPTGRVLESHVHYRVIGNDGLMGPVNTVYV